MQVDETLLESLLKDAESFEGPKGYAGLSWRHLRLYNQYEEPGSDFKLTEVDASLTQIYAGLAVLSKAMHEYLARSPRQDATPFEEAVAAVVAEERKRYGAVAFPYDDPQFPYEDELKKFPNGLAEVAAQGEPTVKPLGCDDIRHEWTVKVGKKLFVRFGEKLREVICGAGGPYERFKKDLIGQDKLPKAVVVTILAAGISTATFWYPLAVYVGLLLVKTGLKVYCET